MGALGFDRALATANGHDRAAVEKLIGDEDRLIDDTARIVAQIEYERRQRVLVAQLGKRSADVRVRRLDEPRDREIADARLDDLPADALLLDLRAHEDERARIFPTR